MKNNQKGITLIALIITIVILLILAVAAISAVTNQDILFKSQEATKTNQIKEEEEKLELEINEWVVLKYTEQGATDLGTFLAEKYDSVETVSEGTYKVTTENGNQFTVTEDGATYVGTTGGEEESQEVIWSKREDGILVSTTGETAEIGVTTYTTSEVLEKLGLTAVEGKYNGNWVVLGLDGTKLKLVSQENVGSDITLGYNDPTVNLTEIEEIYNSSDLNLEKSIWSYEHALDTLHTAAKTQTGIESARSITREDLEAEDVLNITDEEKAATKDYYGYTFKYFLDNGKIYCRLIKIDDENIDDEVENGWSAKAGGKYDVFVNSDKTIIDSSDANSGRSVKVLQNYHSVSFTEEHKAKFATSLANGCYWTATLCTETLYYRCAFACAWVKEGRFGRRWFLDLGRWYCW